MARNEQLRSNLLRSISHDIRTPLTSISGNASNLLSHYDQLDEETLRQIFSDIYDDSEWLVDLVENLLSISRIENGQMELHMTLDIISDVIEEALRHVDRNISRHHVTVAGSDDILLVNMDTGLIMQVLINLINNAIKNTPERTDITIGSQRMDGNVIVSVCDNGPGIADEMKPHIFEMFYTGQNKIADGRRGMGLGLARLRVTIRRLTLMNSDNSADRSVYTNGRLEINYSAGCAFLNGEELKLTPMEYKLLCLLAKNTGKVLTHTYITQNIWGRSWDNDIASLRVFMVTLRKKLESAPGSPRYIQTHIGIGYRMLKVD